MDNLGKNWQLINILFCGYQRRLDYWRLPIHQMCRNLYSPGAQVPQRVITIITHHLCQLSFMQNMVFMHRRHMRIVFLPNPPIAIFKLPNIP